MPSKTLTSRIRTLPAAIKSWWGAEGSWRGPFYGQGENGGMFRLDSLGDGFQRNLDVSSVQAERYGPVYACVAILSQELARIPIKHYRTLENKQREEITNKAPSRVFHTPNKYQTKSDFILWMMRSLLLDGNAYAVAKRNDRFEVDELYPVNPRMMMPYITPEGGDIFYRHSDNVLEELSALESSQWFPQRDVLHIRLFTPRHPLIGESPITAAMFPAATGVSINQHTAAFFHNMGRPSGILRHPKTLSQEAMQRLKQRFAELVTGPNTGEPVVLQEDMTWSPMTMSAVDSEIIASARLAERQIAQVFRIPPFLLGDLDKASFQNVESLSRYFISSALGFYIDHFEDAIGRFFGLPRTEYIRFDVESALLRADLKERMDAYAKGIQSGVLAPNEARQRESLPPVKDGDEPRVQQQLVPLSYGVNLQPKGMESGPASEPKPDAEDKPEPSEEQQAAAAFVARKAIEKAMSA